MAHMKGGTGLTGRALAIGIGLLIVVGLGAGVGGYELGLRAASTGALTSSSSSMTPSPSIRTSPSPVAPGSPASGEVPSPRGHPSWVYDTATGKFLLYGGNLTTGNYNEFPQPLGDTWSWDGGAWTRITSTAPSPRFGAQVVYDDSRKVVLLYGGFTGSSADVDTWTWDGTRWLEMGPSQTPNAGSPTMAFDSTHRVAVLVALPNPYSGSTTTQTWTWDGADWRQVTAAVQPSVGLQYGALAYDPGRKMIVLFSHAGNGQPETWVFDGTNWTQTPTTSGTTSQKFAMSRDDATSNIVQFGENGDTWMWDGSKWIPGNPLHSPGPRQGMSLTYDSAHRVVSLLGGDTGQAAGLQHHNDVWSWDGTDWTRVNGS